MSIKCDNRSTLTRIVQLLNETDTKQLLAFAAGFEAGKSSNWFRGPENCETEGEKHVQLFPHGSMAEDLMRR